MTDTHDKKTRSYNMSQIKAKNTKPEMLVRQFLFAKGLRYKIHDKSLPGKPDLIFPKYKTLIFVHGCFWHGHKNCKYFRMPKSKLDYWEPKISKNIQNDKRNIRILKEMGWKVIVIWECQLKKLKIEKSLQNLHKKILY